MGRNDKASLRIVRLMMRVLLVAGPRRIEIAERERPSPGAGEVLVRVRFGGLCGTDLHVYQGAFGAFPAIPGHDVAGEIVAVGVGVAPARVGERVTIDPAACCLRSAAPGPVCAACARGATNLCAHGSYMGISAPGAFQECIAVPSARAVRLPDAIDDRTATVLEPVVVALHLMEQIADRPGLVLVVGAGPIGAVAAALLARAGREVVAVEPVESRRRMALEIGAPVCVAPDEIPSRNYRVIVEASGHPSATATVLAQASPGASVVLVGGPIELPGRAILTRELEVRAAKGGRGLYPQAIEAVMRGDVAPGRLISHVWAAREAETAFALADANPGGLTRGALDFSESWAR